MGSQAILCAIILVWVFWCALSLRKKYAKACKIGLPVVISPISSLSTLWLVTVSAFFVRPLLKLLPDALGRFLRFTYIGWPYDDGHKSHAELGPAFVLCTPGMNEIIIA